MKKLLAITIAIMLAMPQEAAALRPMAAAFNENIEFSGWLSMVAETKSDIDLQKLAERIRTEINTRGRTAEEKFGRMLAERVSAQPEYSRRWLFIANQLKDPASFAFYKNVDMAYLASEEDLDAAKLNYRLLELTSLASHVRRISIAIDGQTISALNAFDEICCRICEVKKAEFEKAGLSRINSNPSGEGTYWPVYRPYIIALLQHLDVRPNDSFLEVGSANAVLSFAVSSIFKIRATGVEVWEPFHNFAMLLKDAFLQEGVPEADLVTLINKNIVDKSIDFSKYSLIYHFALGIKRKKQLREKMLKVKKGCRIIFHGLLESETEGVLIGNSDFKTEIFYINDGSRLVQIRVYTRINNNRDGSETNPRPVPEAIPDVSLRAIEASA